jgi:competence protein ComEC
VAAPASAVPGPRAPEVGEILRVRGVVEPLGRYDAYQHRRGALAAVAVEDVGRTGTRRGGVAGALDAVRRRAEAGLDRGLPPPQAALLRGMVLGEDERLDEDERTDFQRSGLAHILAVSGQNVMLLAALVMGLGALTGLGLRLRLCTALGLVALYVPLTGAGPSIQRAGVMGAAGLVAALSGRPASRWYALGLAAAVTLAVNPLTAGQPGWQLSFAAVVALLALGPPLREALGRHLPAAVADAAAITVAATLGTAPLMAFHFEQVSLVSLPANLLAAAAVAPIMWLGMLAAAAAQVDAALAMPFAVLAAPLLAFVAAVAHAAAGMPAAVASVPLRSPLLLALAYAAMGAPVLALRARWRHPAGGAGLAGDHGPRGRAHVLLAGPRRRRAGLAVAGLAVVVAGVAHARAGPAPPAAGEVVVSFLDVGQGDATLVQDGTGASVLFDGGPPEAPIYRELRSAGVRRLDLVVSTHQSRDHQGGLHEVLARIPTRLLLENGYGTRDPDYHRLLAEADARDVHHVAAEGGEVLRVGGLTIQVLGPRPRPPGAPPPDDPNPIGVAAIVSEGAFDLWLSADAESDAILQYPLRPVEAMKVSHHGSGDEGLPEVLARLRPTVAAIEVGAHNTYGHPTAETLAALHAAVPHVYRTDRDGTVTLRVDRFGAMRVETAR